MCLFKMNKNEQMIVAQINKIISDSGYQLVLYKKDYRHFGNSIIKFVCTGKKNIKIITDRNEVIFDNKTYPMSLMGDITKFDRDTLVLKFIEIVFDIVKSDDWRITGQEGYLLFVKLKEIIPNEYIDKLENHILFHEHCEFCMDKVEEHKDDKWYCSLDNYRWICKNCYNDFKNKFRFIKIGKGNYDS